MNYLYQGFIKAAVAQGADEVSLTRQIQAADDLYISAVEAIKEAEERYAGFPFREVVANYILKQADGEGGTAAAPPATKPAPAATTSAAGSSGMSDFNFANLANTIGNALGLSPEMAQGLLGMGGGGLAGLLLTNLLGMDEPMLPIILMALLGGLGGYTYKPTPSDTKPSAGTQAGATGAGSSPPPTGQGTSSSSVNSVPVSAQSQPPTPPTNQIPAAAPTQPITPPTNQAATNQPVMSQAESSAQSAGDITNKPITPATPTQAATPLPQSRPIGDYSNPNIDPGNSNTITIDPLNPTGNTSTNAGRIYRGESHRAADLNKQPLAATRSSNSPFISPNRPLIPFTPVLGLA